MGADEQMNYRLPASSPVQQNVSTNVYSIDAGFGPSAGGGAGNLFSPSDFMLAETEVQAKIDERAEEDMMIDPELQ